MSVTPKPFLSLSVAKVLALPSLLEPQHSSLLLKISDAPSLPYDDGGKRGNLQEVLLMLLVGKSNCSTGPKAYLQVRINTTDYFLDPDGIGNDGVPGTAAPYLGSVFFQPSFNLYPDVYVLPGQVWDVRHTYHQDNWVAALENQHSSSILCTTVPMH